MNNCEAMHKMIYGSYRNQTFSEIFPTFNDFKESWNNAPDGMRLEKVNGADVELLPDAKLETIYYLLAGEYMNSPIASSSEDRFKMILNQYLFAQGPKYFKKLEIQSQLRNLNLNELREGSKMIYNKAFNDSTPQSIMDQDYEADYINEQNVSLNKKNKAEALYQLYVLLRSDITAAFVNVFKKLFLVVVSPQVPLYYESEVEDNE